MEKRVRTSAVVIHADKILTFKAIDPHSKKEYFFLPGGKIESGESPIETCLRETIEETGYQVNIISDSAIDREYIFEWNGGQYDCLTIFYKAYLTNPFQQPKTVQDAAYNQGVHWLPVSEIKSIFDYHPDILSAIQELINS